MLKYIICAALLISAFSTRAEIPFYLERKKVRQYVENEVIVKYKNGSTKKLVTNSINKMGALKIGDLYQTGLSRIKISKADSVESAIAKLQADPQVEYAQPNYIYHITATPNDTNFNQLWGLKNIGQTIAAANGPNAADPTQNPGSAGKDMNMTAAWDQITDCSSAVVAVIDTGVNYNHPDLSTNMWDGGLSFPKHGYNFVDNNTDPMDVNGHGTHVAGTIGAVGDNNLGTTGVCWKASIMALRVGDAAGAIYSSALLQAINFARVHNAKVINMSIGGSGFDSAFNTAVQTASDAGIVVVVAAGNDGANNDSGTTPTYPCNFSAANIVCVAALNQAYGLASFSNYGATSVDVAAPGVNILSTWPGSFVADPENLNTGWTSSTTQVGGSWGYKTFNIGGSNRNFLVNPADYDYATKLYKTGTDDRVWKTFSTSPSATSVVLAFNAMYDLENNADFTGVYISGDVGDPMSTGARLDHYTGTTNGYLIPQEYDITSVSNTTIRTVGFQLTSNGSVNQFGVNISSLAVKSLVPNGTTYNVLEGTSMATPHVAGLAAMIFAFNPNYTPADVIVAIKNGGDTQAVLAGKTVTGKSVNALGSLSYISQPTNVTVSK